MWDDKVYKELELEFKTDNKIKGNTKYNYKKFLYGIILFVILLPQIVLLLTKKTYEITPNLDNLPEPIQSVASGGTTMKIYGTDVQIDFLAKYDIKGKVISIRDYAGTDIEKGLGPRDFVLGWGKMSKQEVIDKFKWNDMRNRFIYIYVQPGNEDRFDQEFSGDIRHGNLGTAITHFSNNHPIPANKKIRNLMKKIKEGDVVRLQGYLVYAHWETNKGKYWRGPSSLVRDDRDSHSCEIIYVTDVTRLKEK